ncbi:MAG: DNA recombination protein RmuC [Ferruginibacter sp.]
MNQLLFASAAGVILAGLICWLYFRNQWQQKYLPLEEKLQQQQTAFNQLLAERNTLQTDKDILLERAATAESRNSFLDDQYRLYGLLQLEYQLSQNQLSTARATVKNTEEKLEQQKEELNNIGQKFQAEFRNLAQTLLDEKAKKFTEVNEQNMSAILTPLKTQLVDFKQKVEDTYDKESKERFSLGKEVERLISMTQQVSLEANNLTSALKGNNKMQGNWGEMILESILENTGLTKNREYFLQEFIRDNAGNVIKDENGKGLQPDVIIVYPDQRKVIIDSKVSLIAWDESVAQADITEQKRLLLEHIKSIRQHIDGLSKKNYPRYASALDYVLLFIPIEPAFLEALKTDVQLWKYAYDKNILLVSPTNLFAVLKIVADLWKVEQQNRNAIEIANKAGSLYDKFAGFIDNFELIGKRLTEAGTIYDNAHKQLTSGRGNITGRVEELKKMGANAQKQLPDKLLQELGEED